MLIFTYFLARDSAEASAEASVDLAEASGSAESRFRAIRSFTRNQPIRSLDFFIEKTENKTNLVNSERPKREKLVSAETEASAESLARKCLKIDNFFKN